MPASEDMSARESAAASLFAGLLAHADEVSSEDFEALCQAHPEHEVALRRLREHWDHGRAALNRAVAPETLSERLRAYFGREIDPKVSLDEEPKATAGSAWSNLFERLRTHANDETRYKPKGEVARGGMGAILKVWDEDLRRVLAKKVLIGRREAPPGVDARREFDRIVGRFLEEAQITAQLDHPGIVPVHELGIDSDGRVYFTMRFVRGRELKAIFELVEKGAEDWNLPRAVGVLLRVCEAMAFAHEKGVVHRDLKPSNVMVGRFGEVYVMDWGLARVMGREDTKDLRLRGAPLASSDVVTNRSAPEGQVSSPLVTMDGDVVGTPAYMSPEQARGELAELGPRSDVYSVGAMLYQLLTGEMPYVRSGMEVSPHAVWRWVLDGPPAPVESLRAGAPPELVAICEKAMARAPEQRYPDMLSLAADLRAFLENRVVRSYRTGALAEAKKWIARNRLAAGVSLALLVVVVAGALLSAWLEGRRRNAVERSLVEQTAAALVSEADELEVIDPTRVPAMREWLGRARSVAPHAEAYTREVAAFEAAHAGEPRVDDAAALRHAPDPFELARMETQLSFYAEQVSNFRARIAELEAQAPRGEREEQELARLRGDVTVLDLELADLPARIAAFHEARDAVRTWRYADPSVEERYARIAGTAAYLRELAREDGGLVARTEQRLALAESLAARTIETQRAEWDAARASIADRAQCPAYEGLALAPQIGLVPLRRDPRSGLWEFWHVLSGERPLLGANGRWRIEPETGIVLVLVPGGRALLGAQSDDPLAPNYVEPRRGLELTAGERGSVEAQLAPYFLSKYELTQAQWLRLTGARPSEHFAGKGPKGAPYVSRTHPVENVSCDDCQSALDRWGLALPTEAQWEHAARAGTDTAYWSGPSFESLVGAASWAAGLDHPADADRYPYHAPVGSLDPNPWGFHDISGNVWEWCADWYDVYARIRSVGERDGLLVPSYSVQKVQRGGSFKGDALDLRVSRRMGRSPASRDEDLGVRPSRAIRE